MDEKKDYMTHCDSGMALQDTPHGSERCFQLKGGTFLSIQHSLAQRTGRQQGGFTLPEPKQGFFLSWW